MKAVPQYQLEMLLWLEEHPLATTREISEAFGLTHGATHGRLWTLLVRGRVARQPGFSQLRAEPYRWQVVPR